jgi:hypothetical protein
MGGAACEPAKMGEPEGEAAMTASWIIVSIVDEIIAKLRAQNLHQPVSTLDDIFGSFECES